MTSAEQIDLADRLATLIAGLLCHQRQPGLRTRSSFFVLDARRRAIAARLRRDPDLAAILRDSGWLEIAWCDAIVIAAEQTYATDFPAGCPWQPEQIMEPGWLPGRLTMDLLSVVTLRQALPDGGLSADSRGTVVDFLDAETVLVEFADAQCIVPVPVAQLDIVWSPEPDPRAFAADLVTLLTELLRWQQYPALRTPGGRYSVNALRGYLRARADAPTYADPGLLNAAWGQALVAAPRASELPAACPWPLSQILDGDWFPAD